ncbi:MAG: fused MFS/spermidine synthase [Brevundimonas sp.]|uniref:fused MFS/spermidine synthase n=1 Tax=Brevundimonas sp. TaxID=1871086 RepID=UPI00391A9217
MTDTVDANEAPRARGFDLRKLDPRRIGFASALFAVTIFTSALLVFVVQPMVTKLTVPLLGGSPSVWNTSMVFFQVALLVGYAYAHLLQRIRSMRGQMMVHIALLAVAALFLPLRLSGLIGDPDTSQPILWLMAILLLSVGLPFAVLSATAPLVQAWFARARAGEADGANPYVLYAASNLGSFLALISYPLLVEPLATLTQQRIGWSIGYGLFAALIVALLVVTWRKERAAAPTPLLERSAPIAWRERLIWVALAAIPSSLMLGVTAHLSTDVASVPFLWVLPLALYLLTFVIAFQSRALIPYWLTLTIQAALAAATTALMPFRTGEWLVIFAMHIATFFFTALMCHQHLAARRPPADRLTEFYLWLSVGGAVGGAFTALLAPSLFEVVLEYPLVLVLAALVRPWGRGRFTPAQWALLGGVVMVVLIPPVLMWLMRNNSDVLAMFTADTYNTITRIVLGVAAVTAFMLRERALLFLAALAMISVSAHRAMDRQEYVFTERSFFGVVRVARFYDAQIGGWSHMMMHGTTLHGAQSLAEEFRCAPTLYYAPQTPMGEAARLMYERSESISFGIVGQGTGAMAAYKRFGDTMTFYEIDPMVDRISRDPDYFSFITGCADGPVNTVIGDARVTLRNEPDGLHDLLVIDAFSSDAIPTHLLTVEAIREYLRVVKPDGVVLLHLSNRNIELAVPTVNAARALGAHDLHRIYIRSSETGELQEASSEVVIISATPEGLEPFRESGAWRTVADIDVRPWTDDYVDLVGAIRRNIEYTRR